MNAGGSQSSTSTRAPATVFSPALALPKPKIHRHRPASDLDIGDVKPGDVKTFEYSLKPKYPIKAKTPATVAYEYYTPANRANRQAGGADGGGKEVAAEKGEYRMSNSE